MIDPATLRKRLQADPGYYTLSAYEKQRICNGAGAAGDWRSKWIPNTMWGLDCRPAFDIHDYGYYIGVTQQDKERNDTLMLINLLKLIDQHGGVFSWVRRYRAITYYSAVREHGDEAFWAGKERCDQ